MEKLIPIAKMDFFLEEEFMKPLNISAKTLATAINVPEKLIVSVISDKAKVDADLSIRLGKYFGISEKYFLNIQNDIDERTAKRKHAKEFAKIKPLKRSSKKISLA